MEDLVKDLFLRLGHDAARVIFQVGRIDIAIRDAVGRSHMVVEVKRSLTASKDRDAALRQGFDYAARTGARFVVITDADAFEIYDRTAGLDHAGMLRGKFRLTAFRPEDATILDLLRAQPG
jgi:predicted type IV restriction endonuclease